MPLDECPDAAATRHLARYWNGLRQGRPVPARHAIDPAALSPYLGQSGLIDRDRTGIARFRLVGAALRARLRLDPSGLPLRMIFHPDARGNLDMVFADVFDAPALLTMTVTDGAQSGQFAMLPLSDRHGGISRAVFVMSLPDRPGNAPVRLRSHRAQLSRITPGRTPAGRPVFRVIRGGRA